MKKYPINPKQIIIFLTFFVFYSQLNGQKSFEFASSLPVEGIKIIAVNPMHFGTYESKKGSHFHYEFNENGIFVNTINIQAISKETLRESSTYFIRNEHVFGVTEDSIPYVFQDDNYYFGVRNSIQLIGDTTENKLHELDKSRYILNYKSANGFTPALVEFKEGELHVSDFDYDSEGKIFKKIKEQELLEFPNSTGNDVLLNPTMKEWQKMSLKELFPKSQSFKKIETKKAVK